MDYKELEEKYRLHGNTVGAYFAALKDHRALEAKREYYSKSLNRVIKEYEKYKEKVKKNLES